MMASSLNCLTVGDQIPDNLLDSPARPDSIFYSRPRSCWRIPPPFWRKLNTYGGLTSYGYCIWGSDGELAVFGVMWEPLQAVFGRSKEYIEAEALNYGLQKALRFGYKKLIAESYEMSKCTVAGSETGCEVIWLNNFPTVASDAGEMQINRYLMSADILGGVDNIWIQPGAKVLYLGAASGTIVSLVSDLVGPEGCIYAVEFSHRSGRDLVNMAKKRTNVIPITEDARHPAKHRMLVGMVDVIFFDVAQPDQPYTYINNKKR
ncbi:hypothetical protein SOVF_147810 isoform C [Spinacia oleracea]|nr:hypothetical protein SOVF_147810 isoform C [Spinacia oleracea]